MSRALFEQISQETERKRVTGLVISPIVMLEVDWRFVCVFLFSFSLKVLASSIRRKWDYLSGRHSRRNLRRAYVQWIFSRLRKEKNVPHCSWRRTKERVQWESNFPRVASSHFERTVLDRSKQLECLSCFFLPSPEEGETKRERKGTCRLPRLLDRIFPRT